jgi:type I restriction enzyme, S subunit
VSNFNELPAGWAKAPIPDLIGANGVFIDGDWVESKDQDPQGDIRLVQLADIGDGFFINKSNRFMTMSKAIELRCTFLKKGDVLIARMPDPLGRACLFPGDPKESVTVVDVCIVRSSMAEHFDQKWLMHFINAHDFRERINSLQSGSTRKRISRGNLATLSLPIPPRNEQTRIVEKLEEFFSDIDSGVAELKAAKNKLVQYRQSLLKAAVVGQLTAEWRTKNKPKETGAQLLESILKERCARWKEKQLAKFKEQGKTPPKGWQDKYPEPVQPDTTNLPELPAGWVWMTIDQLSIVVRGASPRPAGDPKYFGGNIPWITVGSITAEDTIYLEKVSQFVTEAGMQASRYIETDTLLLTNSGATLGVPKILRIGGCINDGSVALLDVEDPTKHYLYWFLTTQTKSLRALNQGAAQPNLNTNIVRNIVVPICPVEEMNVINNLILNAIENAKQQEIALFQSLKQSEAQRKNILKTAFSGQLVPQDPNDEPAGVLLERIQEERKKQSAQPKQSKAKVTKEISIVSRKLIDVLTEAGDWLPAQEAFRRCGIADSATTEQIEDLYSELRRLDKENRVIVEPVVDANGIKQYDRLRIAVKG